MLLVTVPSPGYGLSSMIAPPLFETGVIQFAAPPLFETAVKLMIAPLRFERVFFILRDEYRNDRSKPSDSDPNFECF